MVDRSDDYKKYLPKVECPRNPRKPIPIQLDQASPEDIRKFADKMEEFQEAQKEFLKRRNDYNLSVRRGEELFHEDLIREDLNSGIPKVALDKAYFLAWEHGHSSGFGEVENYYENFVEVAREYHDYLKREGGK